jgi:hypothetical protein
VIPKKHRNQQRRLTKAHGIAIARGAEKQVKNRERKTRLRKMNCGKGTTNKALEQNQIQLAPARI